MTITKICSTGGIIALLARGVKSTKWNINIWSNFHGWLKSHPLPNFTATTPPTIIALPPPTTNEKNEGKFFQAIHPSISRYISFCKFGILMGYCTSLYALSFLTGSGFASPGFFLMTTAFFFFFFLVNCFFSGGGEGMEKTTVGVSKEGRKYRQFQPEGILPLISILL